MRHYTSKEQTAKLVGLGFEMPKSVLLYAQSVDCDNNYGWRGEVKYNCDYTIGELIEMLPTTIMDKIWWGKEKGEEGIWGLRIDTECTDYSWVISYRRDNSAYLYQEGCSELVDALYDMIIRLKEKGVI